MPGVTLLGLGPGNPEQITLQAWDVIKNASELWLRTDQHPVVSNLPDTIDIQAFDPEYEQGEAFEDVYEKIVARVIELAQRPQGVIYAVPGDPYVAEATCPVIAERAQQLGLTVRVVHGMSFLEAVFGALKIDPYPKLVLMDALTLSDACVPGYPPNLPVLVAQVYSRMVAAEVKMTLGTVYPDEHPVRMVHAAGTLEQVVEDIPLYQIDRSQQIGTLTCLYIPPLADGTSFEAFQEVVARLRAPDGCPWDREQTHLSLRPHLLEEAYEALAAMDSGDAGKMAEELGDLLLQIVLNAQIASEELEFTMVDVVKGIHDKIVRRHPHVFSGVQIEGVKGVLLNWEKLKASERKINGGKEAGLLDGVPLSLPALSQAQEYQDRAVRVGFDWPDIGGVLDKLIEEVSEVRAATDGAELAAEIGDLLFTLVNFSRWKNIDAESALRAANTRFKKRFAQVEQGASEKGVPLTEMSLDEMEALWQLAKNKEG